MGKAESIEYAIWQRSLFWLSWVMLFLPGYFIWYGFSMIGSLVLNGYNDTIDLVLLLIIGVSLLELLLVALYTLTRFWYQERSFSHLLLWLMLGVAGIPLVTTLGSIFSYATLVLHH